MAFLQDQIYNEELLSKAELCKADSTYLAPEVCEIDLYIWHIHSILFLSPQPEIGSAIHLAHLKCLI